MGKFEPIDGKSTVWAGLWWHPEYNGYSSEAIGLSDLRKFKGAVRLYVRKNKYFNNGENGRPNYTFCLKDSDSAQFKELEVETDRFGKYSKDDDCYYDEEGNRLYTSDEVRTIINGTVSDVKYGISDPYDILPSDFV